MSRYDFVLRMLVLGDHGVGKTALLQTFRRQNLGNFRGRRHSVPHRQFVTVDIKMTLRNKHILIKAVDTGGQEKFRSLTASYYRGAHGCLVLFDVTKETTFDSLTYWLHDLKEYSTHPEISTVLVGTKCHVAPEQRQVSFERAQKYAESVGLPYMEVSAEEGKNVTEVFEKLADIIIERITKGQTPNMSQPNRLILGEKPKPKKTFCSC